MRIDSHQHFWYYDPAEHVWMSAEMQVLMQDYLPADLEPLLQQAGIDGTVAVQARQSLDETRWLLELADQHDFVRGVVGWVDLRSPDIEDQLIAVAHHPKLVGVRHVVHDEPDDDFMLGEEFQRGISKLQGHGLIYDLLLFPRHLPVALQLVQRFDEQPFVLDHIAKPPIAKGVVAPWDDELRRLAEAENVYCKLSGMVTEANWTQWQPRDLAPYLDIVIEAFGAERVMIGSDWPVCTLAADYASTLAVVGEYVEQLSETEKAGILGENCARIYGLPAANC